MDTKTLVQEKYSAARTGCGKNLVPQQKALPQRLKPRSKQRVYRSAEALRHPKNKSKCKSLCSTLPWNPTLAHKTRKDGAPGP